MGEAAWSRLKTREREIWCQWHAVVFVRVEDNGAIAMGPRWSKDSRTLGQGTLARCGRPWMGPKIEGGQCQQGPRFRPKAPGRL